jgi:hypothetical protein
MWGFYGGHMKTTVFLDVMPYILVEVYYVLEEYTAPIFRIEE